MENNVVFRPTVILGLGGTGHEVILKLKRQLMEMFGIVPPIIRFLSVDTTENTETTELTRDGREVTLDDDERLVINVNNPAQLLGGHNTHIDEWWPDNIPMSAINSGAGQVRARGRLALFAHAHEIMNKIDNMLRDVRLLRSQKEATRNRFEVSASGGVEVYIVGSIAGGTGAGMLLDFSFMTRHKLADTVSNITGVIVLPRIFSSLPGTHLVKPNAYGALKEIERLSTMKPMDAFEINYGVETVRVERPPFDLLYLIDAENENGRAVAGLNDLSTMIADGLYLLIGSQIGTNERNTVDNIKTFLAVAPTAQGRSVAYSSFGVASLSLPLKQYQRRKIESLRAMVNDGLLSSAGKDEAVEADVTDFITHNRLREHDHNDDVIDALIKQPDGAPFRAVVGFGGMKFDRHAEATMRELRRQSLVRIEQTVSRILEINYRGLLTNSEIAINAMWDQIMNQPGGVSQARKFLDKLAAKMLWYKQMMEGEARDFNERRQSISYKPLEDQIRIAAESWIQVEQRVRDACHAYKDSLDRECDFIVQIARRNKAAELYGGLWKRVQQLIERSETIRSVLRQAAQRLDQAHLDLVNERTRENLFEHVLPMTIEDGEYHETTEDFLRWYHQESGSFADLTDLRTDDVLDRFMAFADACFAGAVELSIEEVLSRLGPERASEELSQMAGLAAPLWRYDISRIPLSNNRGVHELFHIGVADRDTTIFATNPAFGKGVPRGQFDTTFVSTEDPHRLVMLRVKSGIPLFALHGMEDMERAYRDPDKAVSNHIDREWEQWPSIFPHSADGSALKYFAIAQAPEFGLITRRQEWYYIKSKKAKKVEGGLMKLAQGRVQALSKFSRNMDLVKETGDSIEEMLRRVGEAQIMTGLRKYAENLSQLAQHGNPEPSVKDQIEMEIAAIDDYVTVQKTIR